MARYRLTYYPWITQHKEPAVIRANVDTFARLVEVQMKKSDTSAEIIVEPVLEVPAQVESIVTGRSDILLTDNQGVVRGLRACANLR